jgi:hypothetical protein
MKKRNWHILPVSNLGKWSFWLIVAMLLLFLIGMSLPGVLYKGVASGDTLLADIAARPALALSMLAGMICGTASFISGLLAFITKKDFTVLVFLSTLIGALLVVFLIGEVVSPH